VSKHFGLAVLAILVGVPTLFVESAYSEAQHDKVPADVSEHFRLECKSPDSLIHIVIQEGEIQDVKIDLPNHVTVDRNEQYPLHSNAYKESEDWYVWTGVDNDFKHYMRGNLIHTDSIFTYQEIRHTIAPNGGWSDTKLVVDTSNCGGD
jgi:hypothetical protein